MTTTTVRGTNSIVWWLVAGMLAFGVLALVNVPPAAIDAHAWERHGEDAAYAWNEYQRGDCTEVYRSVGRNRVVHLLMGDRLLRTGIITTLGGAPVTAYPAPAAYWAIRLADYERVGSEGDCR